MALSQTGATYKNQAHIQRTDRLTGEAFDDIASQIQTIRTQGNFGKNGPVSAPHPLSAIQVSAVNGFATVKLTHNKAPVGSNYVIEYSTTPNFQDPIQVDNGASLTMQQYLKGQKLYFRGAPKFSASPLAQWTYFGGQSSPKAVSF